eukprot:764210-Prorocentrum_minimum.AAC.1
MIVVVPRRCVPTPQMRVAKVPLASRESRLQTSHGLFCGGTSAHHQKSLKVSRSSSSGATVWLVVDNCRACRIRHTYLPFLFNVQPSLRVTRTKRKIGKKWSWNFPLRPSLQKKTTSQILSERPVGRFVIATHTRQETRYIYLFAKALGSIGDCRETRIHNPYLPCSLYLPRGVDPDALAAAFEEDLYELTNAALCSEIAFGQGVELPDSTFMVELSVILCSDKHIQASLVKIRHLPRVTRSHPHNATLGDRAVSPLMPSGGSPELNKKWRKKDAPTDVLSFPQLKTAAEAKAIKNAPKLTSAVAALGDLVISLETANRQAQARGYGPYPECKPHTCDVICDNNTSHVHAHACAACA